MMLGVKDSNSSSDVPGFRARRIRIDAEQSGQRIDNFLLRELKGVPKSRIYRLLRKGEVRVNGGRIDAAYRLNEQDEVRLPPLRMSAEPEEAVPGDRLLRLLEAAVIYEDDRLLALNKPAGVAVHGGSGIAFGVIEGLRALRPKAPFLELVHRLDRDTSGCLLIAKKRSALRELHELFRAEEGVEKRYLALLAGKLPRGAIPVEAGLDRFELKSGERLVKVSEEGKHARSVFRAIDRFPGATLAEVQISTGRTHQIRVHAAHLGHPVVGDDKYGDREANKVLRRAGVKRLFLHAHRLVLHWPDRPALELTAPLAGELEAALEQLKQKDNEHG